MLKLMRWSLVALCYIPASVQALEFDFRFQGVAAENEQLQAGMRQAADQWSRYITDPVTVRLDVRVAPVQELGFAVGFTYGFPEVVSYSDLRNALVADANSIDDQVSINHLSESTNVVFRANDPDGQVYLNSEQRGINGYFDVPRANAKALSLTLSGDPNSADGEILWNEFFVDHDFDYDPNDGVTGTDFISAAVHELGHILGFYSGVDDFDESSLPNGPFAPTDLREFAILNVPDLFRYSTDSLPNLDLTLGGEPFFSVDGGRSVNGEFATGAFNGDGTQASHWKDGHGIMDGFIPESTSVGISTTDLRLMDIIGWDVARSPVAEDVDLLIAAILSEEFEPALDFDNSGAIDSADLHHLVSDKLGTYRGDANLDGEFNSGDLVQVFQAGSYETGNAANWSEGDWNGDGGFDSGDFVAAFQGGGYEQGPRRTVRAVPEPTGMLGLVAALTGVANYWRR